MLRKLVKALIPSKDKVFFDLIVQAADNVRESADILDKIMKEKDQLNIIELVDDLRSKRHIAIAIGSNIDLELGIHFVTPIDRGEIHNISVLMLKLNKKIIKIYRSIQILLADEDVDDYLVNSVTTLKRITRNLYKMTKALSKGDSSEIRAISHRIDSLDDNVIEELGMSLKRLSKFECNVITIMKLKDIYKAIETSINTSTAISETIMRVSVEEI